MAIKHSKSKLKGSDDDDNVVFASNKRLVGRHGLGVKFCKRT